MDGPKFLILEEGTSSCSCGHTQHLSSLIMENFPLSQVCRKSVPEPIDRKFFTPDLIFVRPGSSNKSEEIFYQRFRECWANIPIIGLFCSGAKAVGEWEKGWLEFLDDFLVCPFQEIDVILRLKKFLPSKILPEPLSESSPKNNCNFLVEGLIGRSECFLQEVRKIPALSQSNETVLILGETGTGKEMFARAIHYQSCRSGAPFVPINCGALPEHLFENELFGHVKGAYTDASATQTGLVGEAEGGTLFLDEVDALSLAGQIKLLRFLQDRVYRPLGSAQGLNANIRVCVATNRNLQKLMREGKFRNDLYYRLSTLPLQIPPLRSRIGDIAQLAEHFLVQATAHIQKPPMRISSGALQKMLAYQWPGNVRELEAVIKRAATFCGTSVLEASDIAIDSTIHNKNPSDTGLKKSKLNMVSQLERTVLIELLTTHQGNVAHSAKTAGKDRRSFQRLMQKYGLKRETFISQD